jgi:hypothetical protein
MNRTAMLLSKHKHVGLIGIVHNVNMEKYQNHQAIYTKTITKTYCLILGYSKEDWNHGVYTYLDDKGFIRKTDPYGGYPKINIHKK